MDWHILVIGFIVLVILAGGWGGAQSGASGDEARRAAARAAATKIRYGAARDVVDRQVRGELSDTDAYALLQDLMGTRSGPTPPRPPHP